jgi:hypothetical protein
LAPQERRCNPAVYTSHDAGQIVDQTAPFARLTAQPAYPEVKIASRFKQWSRRTYVWNPKVTTAAPAYMPTTNTAHRGMDRISNRPPSRPLGPRLGGRTGPAKELAVRHPKENPATGRYARRGFTTINSAERTIRVKNKARRLGCRRAISQRKLLRTRLADSR